MIVAEQQIARVAKRDDEEQEHDAFRGDPAAGRLTQRWRPVERRNGRFGRCKRREANWLSRMDFFRRGRLGLDSSQLRAVASALGSFERMIGAAIWAEFDMLVQHAPAPCARRWETLGR
ncbi:hypothetical protein PPGU16_33830 [Paraburkholderia largidicola]|uniref:Uncharacterized protein n=1 Tax=Paraburkholderia largidicola TaxID=3014751 RepID=A0A7I8BNJ8_9BURK|nr:hypothetical protein PPGU16_33830 [Paraburkholderia sp. PGU16]